MKQVQNALSHLGIPVMTGVWRATSPKQNPPLQYVVYSTTKTESSHYDDHVSAVRTFVYLNLWSDIDPTAMADSIDHVKQAVNSMIANGTNIPADSQPNQQFVTDCDGNVGWQDRTHYSHISVMDILPECSMIYAGDSVGIVTQDFQGTPIIDEIYAVEWNGIIYQCPARYVERDGVSSILFGNSYMLDEEMSEIPFMVLIVPEAFRDA